MPSLHWLCFRVGGCFEGLLLIEAHSLQAARMHADLSGLDPGGECEGRELHPDDARAIPRRFIGRLLDEDEVADLERILVAAMHKKPRAASVRRASGQRRRVLP
jgi:hypothetical protein